MVRVIVEKDLRIISVLLWQGGVVFMSALISWFLAADFAAVLFGGLFVVWSTWHVHSTVYGSEGERGAMLRSAGLRFVVFLVAVGGAVFFWGLQPLYVVMGMGVAYATLYIRSLLVILKQVKGDGVG